MVCRGLQVPRAHPGLQDTKASQDVMEKMARKVGMQVVPSVVMKTFVILPSGSGVLLPGEVTSFPMDVVTEFPKCPDFPKES